ncbi:MAG: hypothetical protein ACLQNE_29480 [Thermoguttaceae bacterium]
MSGVRLRCRCWHATISGLRRSTHPTAFLPSHKAARCGFYGQPRQPLRVWPYFQERTWRAFLRTVVDGAGAVEVAAELKITTRAVRQAKHRGLQRLGEQFGDLID